MAKNVMTTNAILRSKGLYDDVIGVIGDFLFGARDYYKVVFNMILKKEREDDMICILQHFRLTKNCRNIFNNYRGHTIKHSMSYNKYIQTHRLVLPAHMELFTRQVAKHKSLITQSKRTHKRLGITTERKELEFLRYFGINEKFYNKFILNPEYFEGSITTGKGNIKIPYFTPPPINIQQKQCYVITQIKQYNEDKIEKKRREENTKPFGAGYIIDENDFIQIKVIKERSGPEGRTRAQTRILNCIITAKGVKCSHEKCALIYRENKVKTKKISYPIRIGEDGIRYILYKSPIQNCEKNPVWGTEKIKMERREDMWEAHPKYHNMTPQKIRERDLERARGIREIERR